MATVAANAVRNFDLSRAIEVLGELSQMASGRTDGVLDDEHR